MKIGLGVSELWRIEYRRLPLTWPMAYTIACTTSPGAEGLDLDPTDKVSFFADSGSPGGSK